MLVDAASTSPQRLPSGMVKRCSPRARKTAFCCLGEGAALLSLLFGDGLVGLVLPLVAEALVEHQRQDVVLVILPGGLATQDVGRAPEVGFELLLGELHFYSLSHRAVLDEKSVQEPVARVKWPDAPPSRFKASNFSTPE